LRTSRVWVIVQPATVVETQSCAVWPRGLELQFTMWAYSCTRAPTSPIPACAPAAKLHHASPRSHFLCSFTSPFFLSGCAKRTPEINVLSDGIDSRYRQTPCLCKFVSYLHSYVSNLSVTFYATIARHAACDHSACLVHARVLMPCCGLT